MVHVHSSQRILEPSSFEEEYVDHAWWEAMKTSSKLVFGKVALLQLIGLIC